MKKSKVMVVCFTFLSSVAFGQLADISAPGAIENPSLSSKNIEFIDDDGNKGVLAGYNGSEGIERISFTIQTEIGESVETYFMFGNEITEIVVDRIEYNRPKFWNEQVAKSNGDDQWFDMKKSVSTQVV